MTSSFSVAGVRRHPRSAFTLVEALIAISMTLVIMLALAQGFKQMSEDISQGRARLALSDQLRGISEILRNDLAGLTVTVDPSATVAKLGYFLYYDGPLADHHPVTVPINNRLGQADATIEQNLSTSKYGDLDDLLMFTARANDDWFRGRVPLALVKGAANGGMYPGYNDSDWYNTVVVASEYAEIAYFMMPEIVPTMNTQPSPYGEYIAQSDLSIGIVDRDTPVNPGGYAITATGNAIPDRMKLCRRVLLILPNLNIPPAIGSSAPPGSPGVLFDGGTASPSARLLSPPINNGLGARLQLANAYQRCDLSVRRAPDPVTGIGRIVANSLEDLANPLNRFAHVTLPNGSIGNLGPEDRTMPILSLTAPIPLQAYAISSTINLVAKGDATLPESGFLRPEFLKRSFDPTTGLVEVAEDAETGNFVEVLSNEEVLAINCVAFDLKGYDPIARLLFHNGSDNLPNNANPSWNLLGATGSDDIEVSPSDPGYPDAVRYLGLSSPPSLAQLTSRQGAFVDLGWGLKFAAKTGSPALSPVLPLRDIFATQLSGIDLLNPPQAPTTRLDFTPSLVKSGRVYRNPANSNVFVYQPCFDSFTHDFEHDGFLQEDRLQAPPYSLPPIIAANQGGRIMRNGNYLLAGVVPPLQGGQTVPLDADRARNGLDDNVDGLIDDYFEQDTSPPLRSQLTAVQAMIRVEDVTAGVIQQIAITHDLVTQ